MVTKSIFIKLLILFLFVIPSFGKELKKVTLQLSWFDQFQFAGYYMAKEKGFYEELGLDVEIKPFQFGLDIPKDVSDGKIDFAVGRETLILERAKDRNIVALYALFQATPLILMSTKESGINSVNDFSNKRVMTTIDDSSEVSLKAMIISNKVKLENLKFLKHTHNINDLTDKNTDVISAYISKSPYTLQKKGVEYNIFDPKKYGFDMYSDMLFTSESLINSDLNTVLLFKKASLKGWEYAYSNIEESAEVIINKYNSQNLTKEEVIYEGTELKKLSYFNAKNLGEIKKDKIQRIYDLYNLMGLVPAPIDLDKFVFDLNNLRDLAFSKSEETYLEQRDVIKMCVTPNMYPFSEIKDDKFIGFSSDIISLIENRIKKSIKFVSTESWDESISFSKNNKCDILPFSIKSKENETTLSHTKSYLSLPLAFVTKNDSQIANLNSLKNKKVSVVANYELIEKLKNKYKDIEFVSVKDIDEGFKKVLNQQVYGHIDTLNTAWCKIQSKYPSKLSISNKIDENIDISIAVNKEDNILYGILQKAILSIDDDTKNELFNKWIFQEKIKEFDYAVIWKISIVLLIIILAILYRQKLLRKLNTELKCAVNEKTKELQEINNQLEYKIKIAVEENIKKDRLLSRQQKMISMGQMIENIAHQWRQPLSLITTSLSAVKLKKQLNDLDDEYLIKSIDTVLNTSKYLSNTIDDFRYFFKPQKEKEKFLLKNCVDKTLELLKSAFFENKISVIEDIDEIVLFGYETELIQVLINILNNSKDALLNTNDKERVVFIEAKRENQKIVIKIKDNAGGIDSEILEKVFEPYFTTKHQSQGTGIGLYMCEEIIYKHMNGHIDVSNVEYEYNNNKYKGALVLIILDIVE